MVIGVTKMKECIVILVVISAAMVIKNAEAAMSDKQIKAAGKLVRNVCQPKSKVESGPVDDMHIGKWDDIPEAKCYMNCVLMNLRIGKKDGSIDYDATVAALNSQLPEDKKIKFMTSMEKCKDEGGADKCEKSWNFSKCMYFDNPENYFFP